MTEALPSHAVPGTGICEWCGLIESRQMIWSYKVNRWLCRFCHCQEEKGELHEIKTDVLKSPEAVKTLLQEIGEINFIKVICPKCLAEYGLESAIKCKGMKNGDNCSLWSDLQI